MPLMGASKVASPRALRAISTAARATSRLACAAASLLTEDSSAVAEMKPWVTKALLLARLRCAMSSCARLAATCCSAWRSRRSSSVVSCSTSGCPAFTASPSRAWMRTISPATRAFTKAVSTALTVPETSSVRVPLPWVAVTMSVGVSSRACGAAGVAAVDCTTRRSLTSLNTATLTAAITATTMNQRNRRFMD